jgi:hypothetical protein
VSCYGIMRCVAKLFRVSRELPLRLEGYPGLYLRYPAASSTFNTSITLGFPDLDIGDATMTISCYMVVSLAQWPSFDFHAPSLQAKISGHSIHDKCDREATHGDFRC